MSFYSRTTLYGNGSATEFVVPFPFFPDTLEVRRGGLLALYGDDYEINPQTRRIIFYAPVPDGMAIKIRRITPRATADRKVIFTNGSDLDGDTLNGADLYLLFIIQELIDDIREGIGVGDSGSIPGGGTVGDVLDLQNQIDQLTQQLLEEHNERVAALQSAVAELNASVASERDARIAALSEIIGDLPALVTNIVNTEVGDVSAIASQLSVVASQLEEALSAIAEERTARIDGDEASASVIADVIARVGDAESAITSLSSAVTTGDSALSTRIDQLQAEVDDDQATFVSRVQTQVAEGISSSSVISGLNSRVGDVESAIADEASARASADEAMSVRVGVIEASIQDPDTGLAKAHARVSSEESARASADAALSSRLDTMESDLNTPTTGLKARLTNVETALADGEDQAAIAARVASLEASVNDPATGLDYTRGRVDTIEGSYASKAYAEALRNEAISAAAGDATTKVNNEATARANADTALSNRTSALESSVNTPTTGLLARVSTIESTKASTASLNIQAGRIDTIESAVNDPSTGLAAAHSRIANEESTRASADTALSNRTTALESTINTPSTGLLARVGSVETAVSRSPGSGNLLINSKPVNTHGLLPGWTLGVPTPSTHVDLMLSNPEPGKTYGCIGFEFPHDGQVVATCWNDAVIAVEAGKRYEFSARLWGWHGYVNVLWYNANGDYITEHGSAPTPTHFWPAYYDPSSIPLYHAFAYAPSGAVTARFRIVAYGTSVTGDYGELYFCHAYFGQCTPEQTEPTPWSEGVDGTALSLASRVTTVEANVGSLSASVTAETSARVNADNSLKAEHVLNVNASGVITGFRVTSLGGSSAPRSDFAVFADSFSITSSNGAITKVPFRIEGGVVYIDEALIKELGVERLRGGTITGKTITLDGVTSVLRSSNYSAGVSGWQIDGSGNAELNSLIVRTPMIEVGAVSAVDGSYNIIHGGYNVSASVTVYIPAGGKALLHICGERLNPIDKANYTMVEIKRNGYTFRSWEQAGLGSHLASPTIMDNPGAGWYTYEVVTSTAISSTLSAEIVVTVLKR